MIYWKHKTMIAVAGVVWFVVGFSLLRVGLQLLGARGDQLAVFLIAGALLAGFLKGPLILGKTAVRAITRIESFLEPVPFYRIYAPQFYLLIALMMGLGMSIRALGLGDEIRGFIDVTVGAALINGASFYFRHIYLKRA